jgi:DNA polymerase (family 10)
MARPENDEIARVLEEIAERLEAQDANPHRVRAYRNGAQSVRNAQEPVARWVEAGHEEKLEELPNVGEGLTRVIATYVKTGRSILLERLQGEVTPEELFAQVPGVGEILGQRIATELEIHSLEELEQAAHDGRLRQVEGFGPKRIRTVQVALAGILSRAAQRRVQRPEEAAGSEERPDVGTLLAVDAEYRRRAQAGELRKIAPKRFNPEGKAWLPVLHTEKDGWSCTALYSNTKRAHDLGKTQEWVVIYYDRERFEGQGTVVTESGGPLAGRRVVRGREAECRRYYEQRSE